MSAPTRERSATRALVLGLLAMPFGIFAPFVIWAGRVVSATPSGGAFSIAVAAAPLSLIGCS